jgi:thiol-disulfide isomerase/thioredoxin
LATDTQTKDQLSAETSSGGSFWALLVLLVAAAATLVAIQGSRPKPANPYVGKIFPPLDAGGWINTKGPLTADDLRGKIVLVDFWASDCLPCIRALPELIDFKKRYSDRGVMIVGLSEEQGQRAVHLKNFIETQDGLDWPNAYDVRLAYELLDIRGTPTYLLYDQSGRSVWGGHTLDGLEDAVTALLAKK